MKIPYVILLFFVSQFACAQSTNFPKIDSSNYYDYYSTGKGLNSPFVKTSWLNISDVVPIMMEEMNKAGLEWNYAYPVYKLETGQYIQLSAYSRKSNVGFLFIQTHYAFPEKKHRVQLTQDFMPGVEFTETHETYTGKMEVERIKKIPSNVFVLNANCYWYQSTDNKEDNAKLVSEETAKNILREDIRKYLKTPGLKTKFVIKSE